MQRQKLIRIIIYALLTIFAYIFTKVLLFSGQSNEVNIIEVKVQRFSRYGFVFPSSFNRSCTSEFLGLPSTMVKYCSSRTGAVADIDHVLNVVLFIFIHHNMVETTLCPNKCSPLEHRQ